MELSFVAAVQRARGHRSEPDGAVTDYVPGTTRNVFNRGDNTEMLALVNTWRAQNGRAPIPESQLMTDEFQRVDVRVSKQVELGGDRRAEVIAQVFNLFGTDSFGIGATPWQMNAHVEFVWHHQHRLSTAAGRVGGAVRLVASARPIAPRRP